MNNNKSIEQKKSINYAAILHVFYDVIAVNLSYFLGLWFRFDCKFSLVESSGYLEPFAKFAPIYSVFCIVIFFLLRLYRSLWRYASFNEFSRILLASIITSVAHWIGITVIFKQMIFSYHLFGSIIQFVFLITVRFGYRFILLQRNSAMKNTSGAGFSKVMLIGAGSAGQMILQDVKRATTIKDVVCCIIDDDSSKWGRYLDGVPIVGGRDDILVNVEKYNIEKIYFAIPSCSEILNICQNTKCEVKNLPGLYQLVNGDVSVAAMKDIAVEDLLGREPIKVEMSDIFRQLSGKVILVTGGGGSIGSELCRQIASHGPKKLIIIDIYENNAYDIQMELIRTCPKVEIAVLIASVRDEKRIDDIFREHRPNIVFHAAAHKHVPLMEVSPQEAVKNNVFGTLNTVRAADRNGVSRFVMISTDKAVNPTNVMGATKRICEMIVQSYDKISKTEFVAVRFGNVLGSNGSVIPLFKKQIAEGGPVTVTHCGIIRYFMTIPEAVSLVLRAGAFAKGGEIFVLDMGKPVKILDLAENLIRLSGRTPYVDIKIEFTGLRPGEKLYEELLMGEEGLQNTENDLIHVGKPIEFDDEWFIERLDNLKENMYDDSCDIRHLIHEIVPTYKLPQ